MIFSFSGSFRLPGVLCAFLFCIYIIPHFLRFVKGFSRKKYIFLEKVLSKEKKERLRSFGLSLKFHDPVQQLPVSLPMPLDELSFHTSLSASESESFLNWLKSSQQVLSISACMVSASKVTPRFSRKSFAY